MTLRHDIFWSTAHDYTITIYAKIVDYVCKQFPQFV